MFENERWYSSLPVGWSVKKFKYVASLYTGNSIKDSEKDNYTDKSNARPYIATKHIEAENNKIDYENGLYVKLDDESFRIAKCGSTLMCIEGGSAGKKKGFLTHDVSFVNKLCCFEPNFRIDSKYLFYYLMSPNYEEDFKTRITGLIGGVSVSELLNMLIITPPLSEQQAIADYLDETCSKIDEIIAEAKASIDEYKELKQSVIFEAVTKGLDKNVEMKAVSFEYLDSCPMNWSILPVSILFDFLGGFAYKSDRFCEETNNQVVRLGNVKDDELRLSSNPVYVSDEYADDSSKAAINVDDILFTMTGTRGKGDYFYTLIITEDDLKEKNLFLNQRVGCFRKAYHTVYMPYYNYLLKSPKIRERVFLYETGTANQGNIGIENINRIRLYNPPMEVQKNIVRMLNQKCSTFDSLIAEKDSLINDLEAYKKSLIYEVVTGKRRVV